MKLSAACGPGVGLDLPGREPQRFRGLRGGEVLAFQQGENVHTSRFFWGQGHLSSSLRERTESLIY
jgi:hypothetical protein